MGHLYFTKSISITHQLLNFTLLQVHPMQFKDYFSVQASDYAKFRPDYPPELFDLILANTPNRGLAWDCATGNGQVALGLVDYFDHIIATDASQSQLSAAKPHPQISYQLAPAENSGLADKSVDLITVGQALHWFNFELFFKEVGRVAKPGALFVAFGYAHNSINPEVDKVVQHFFHTYTEPYWPKERKWVDQHLQGIDIPFEEIPMPLLSLSKEWDLKTLVGYLFTWSGTQQYIKANGKNPIAFVEKELTAAWGQPTQTHTITWPLFIRAVRVR